MGGNPLVLGLAKSKFLKILIMVLLNLNMIFGLGEQ